MTCGLTVSLFRHSGKIKLGKDARAAQAARELEDKRIEKAVYAEGMENFLELQDDEEVKKFLCIIK